MQMPWPTMTHSMLMLRQRLITRNGLKNCTTPLMRLRRPWVTVCLRWRRLDSLVVRFGSVEVMWKADVSFHLSFIGRCQAHEILDWQLIIFESGRRCSWLLACTESVVPFFHMKLLGFRWSHTLFAAVFDVEEAPLKKFTSSHGAAVAVTENGASGGTFSRVSWKQQVKICKGTACNQHVLTCMSVRRVLSAKGHTGWEHAVLHVGGCTSCSELVLAMPFDISHSFSWILLLHTSGTFFLCIPPIIANLHVFTACDVFHDGSTTTPRK